MVKWFGILDTGVQESTPREIGRPRAPITTGSQDEQSRLSLGQNSMQDPQEIVTNNIGQQPLRGTRASLLAAQIEDGLYITALEAPSGIERVNSFTIGDEIELANPETSSTDGFYV
jgi:hypothetical protein